MVEIYSQRRAASFTVATELSLPNRMHPERRKHQEGSQLKEVEIPPGYRERCWCADKTGLSGSLGEGHLKFAKAMIFPSRPRDVGSRRKWAACQMTRLLGEISDHALVEIGPRMEANVLMALLAPKRGGGAPPKAAAS